jgi:hypothetical protein
VLLVSGANSGERQLAGTALLCYGDFGLIYKVSESIAKVRALGQIRLGPITD